MSVWREAAPGMRSRVLPLLLRLARLEPLAGDSEARICTSAGRDRPTCQQPQTTDQRSERQRSEPDDQRD